jgi:DNA-directed RNA polymerase specialized sigma subunit
VPTCQVGLVRDFEKGQARVADVGAELLRHEGLVHAVVRCQWLGYLNYAEALQAGRIGLWQALLRYDPAGGTAFSTYAWPAIARQV